LRTEPEKPGEVMSTATMDERDEATKQGGNQFRQGSARARVRERV
jgi:hypothetical protein